LGPGAVVSRRPRGRGRAARSPGTPASRGRRRAGPRTWATGPAPVPRRTARTRPPPPSGRSPRSAGPRSPARSVAAPPSYLITLATSGRRWYVAGREVVVDHAGGLHQGVRGGG